MKRRQKKKRRKRAEDKVQRIIAEEKNYFNLDILFFKEDKKTRANYDYFNAGRNFAFPVSNAFLLMLLKKSINARCLKMQLQ